MSGSALNILIKILAVLLAVLLWFYVISQKDYEYDLTLPVTEVDYPSGLGLVDGMPDSLSIKIFAEGQKLLGSSWKKAGLKIKANRLRRGVNNLELNLETVSLVRSEDITLLDLDGPALVQIHLDRIDSTYKPIVSRLAVAPAEGYSTVIGSEKVEPGQIMISGPVFLLGRIDTIYTEQKIIDDVKKPVDISLKLDIPRNLTLTSDTDSILVSVAVDKVVSREFKDLAVAVNKTGQRKRVIIDPEKVSLEISGPKSVIDSLNDSDLKVSVTSTATPGSSWVKPLTELPANIQLKKITPDSIRILVEN